MAEKQPLVEALRVEILKLATDGDPKSENALTPDVLMRIMRVAKTGHDLITALNASTSNLAGMVRRSNSPFAFAGQGDDSLGDSASMGSVIPFAPSSMPENFGMTALREIIAAVKNQNGPSPAKLVEALVIARDNGLHDVAKELEGQLGLGKKELVVERAQETKEKEPV
jgi:hypothetical protein